MFSKLKNKIRKYLKEFLGLNQLEESSENHKIIVSNIQEQLKVLVASAPLLISKKEFEENLKDLSKQISENKGAITVLLNLQSHKAPSSPKQSHKLETKIINRIKRNKKSIVITELSKLTPSHTTLEMFDIIVKEKGLCSKSSFYRYIASPNSPKFETETETGTNNLRLIKGGKS